MGKLADYLQNLIDQENEMALQQAEVRRAIDQQKKENTTKALDAIKSLAVSNTERQIAQTTAQQAAQESAKTTLQKYLDKAESAAVQNTQRQIEQTQAHMKAQQEAGTTLQRYIAKATEKPTDALSVAAREERSARKELNAALEQQARLADAGVTDERAHSQQETALQKYISAGKKVEEAGGIAGSDATIGNLAQYGSSLANYLVSTARQMGTDSLQQRLRAAQESFAAAGDTDTAMGLEKTIQAAEDELNTRGALQKALDRGTQWGQEQIAAAKVGRSEAGKFLVDLAMQGEQMAVDAALGGAVGARLLPMYMRASGAGEQEAISEGADARSALLYGNAVGAVEALTEKMYDGVSGIFGKGAADEVIADFVNRVANDKLGRAALQSFFNFAGEAGEEIASGLIDPALKSIYNGKRIGENWSTLEVSELLYDAFVGGVMGLLGGSAEVLMNFNAPLGEQADTRTTSEKVRDTLKDPQALREYIAKYGKLGDTKTEAGRRLSQIMQQEEARAKELRELDMELKSGKKGSLKDETPNGIKKRNLNAQQKVGLRVARTLAEMGNNIHIFQSEQVDGAWVLPENLRAKMGRDGAPNGWYDTETGDIWVDLNAGKDGKGTMAYTLAHEITHKIKASSEVSFGALQDFLNGIYGIEGVSVEELAAERVAEAAAKGKALSMDIAMEEVVADSMEAMFTDARVMDKIDALKARNQSLWKTLRDNVRRWARQFDTAYVPTDPDSVEGRYIKAMRDYVDELAAIFAEGTVKAGAGKEKTSSEEDARFSAREALSTEAEMFREDIDIWDKNGRKNGETFTLGSTGRVLRGLGAVESDVYMLSDKINKIAAEHPEIGVNEIKSLPEILENPVMILQSRNTAGVGNNTRLTLFGMPKAKNGQPIMVVFDLAPREGGVRIEDMQKVVSAYTKDRTPSATAELMKNSRALYLDKEKTASLLHAVGFQNAYLIEQSGFIGSINYEDRDVKVFGKKFSDVIKPDLSLPTGKEGKSGTKKDFPGLPTGKETIRNSERAVSEWVATMQEARQKLNGGNKYSFTTDNGNEFVISALPQFDGSVTASVTKNGEMLISGSYGSKNEAISVLIGEAQKNDGKKLNGMEATWADAGEDPDQLIGTPGGMERAGDRIYSRAEEKPASGKLVEFEDGTAIPEDSFSAAVREAFPNRIDRARAQEIAEKNDYPKLQRLDGKEPQQVIPYYTFVKAMDRGNYGLITSWDPYQGFGVQFINKADGIAGFRYFPANELRAVDARYSDTDGNWWKVEDPGEPVRAEPADYKEEKAAAQEKVDNFTPGGESEIGVEREEEKVKKPKEKNKLYDPEFTINTEGDSETMTEKRRLAKEAEYDTLRKMRAKTKTEIEVLGRLGTATDTLLTDNQIERLADLIESLQAYTDELKTRKAPAQEKTAVKTMPTESAKAATNKLLKLMDIQAGNREAGRTILNGMFRSLVENGKITETEIEEAFAELLELGVSVQEEQSFAGMLYRDLRGQKIYVSEKLKADITDYAELHKQAFAVGITLVNDKSAPSIDQLTMELTDTWGDMFEIDSAPGDQLRNLVDIMEQGKTKHIPKAEAIAKEAAEARVDAEDVIEEYLSEFRAATKNFVESAKAEIKAKDKAAKEMQEQRSYIERAEEKRRQRKRENDIRDRVMAQMKKLSRMGKKASPAQKAAIEELIGNIDLMAKSISPTGVESLEALKRDYDARKAAAGWESEENPGNWLGDNYAEKKLARLGQKHVKDMSVSELLELGNAVSNMITQIENQNRLVDDERHREISETAKQMREELEGGKGIDKHSAKAKLQSFMSFEQLGGRRVFDMLGGWKDGAWHDMGLALEKGGVDKLAFIQDAYSGIKPWLDRNKTWAKTASGKRAVWIEYEVPCITGAAEDGTPITGTVKFEITPMMRVYLIMASKNKDNLRHIAEGGLVLPDKKAYIKGNKAETYSEHRKVRLSPETVRMIANDATEAERGFAAELAKFMDGTAKNAINSVSMQLDGYERAAVDHYWPINSDKVFTKTDAGREANAATAEGTPNIANERVAGANTPVYLEDASDTFARAVESDAKYYGYAIPVRNFNAVWNYTFRMTGDAQSDALKGQIDKKWTSAANAYLKKLVDDIQAPNGASRDMTSRMLNSLKSAMAGSTLAFNPSVALSQVTSYPGAAAVLSQRALLAGLNPVKRADPALIAKYTPVYWSRGDSNADTTMLQGEGMNSDLGQKAPWLFGWIQGMDQLTIRRLWVACDYEVSHKAETKALDGDAHYEAVAELFNKVVHDTQPNYTTFERSQILRSESDLTKALTMFKTVSQQYYGVMFEAQARLQAAETQAKKSGAGETEQKRLAEAQDNWVKSMSATTAANVMYVMVKALFKGIKGTDDDYKEENGDYSPKSIAKGLGKDFTEVTVGSVMFGDLALAFFKSLATGEKFEAPEISSVEVVEDLANALGDLRDIGKYGEEDTARIIKKTAMQLTTVFKGIPAKNMESWTLAFARLVAPEVAAKYDSLFRETTRLDLKELKGDRLKAGVRTLLDSRFGSDDGTDEIARLYAAGYTDAVPTAIPGDFEWTTTDTLGNKTKHEVALTYGTREKYRQAWTKAAELDELLNSKVYQNADDKAKAAMIRGLYDYATQVAREAVSDYEMDSANEKIREANAAGISTATYLSFYYSVKDIQSDKDANGKSISGSAAHKKTVALREMRLSDKETDYLARTIASEACINDYDKVKDYMSFDVWALIYNTYQMTDSKNEKGISVNGLKKKRMEEYLAGMAISEEARKACLSLWYKDYSLPDVKKVTGKSALAKYMELPTGKEGKTTGKSTLAKYMGLPTVKETTGKSALAKYMELPTIK